MLYLYGYVQTHWCLAVIFMTEKRIQYYDSMNGSGEACIKTLFKCVRRFQCLI